MARDELISLCSYLIVGFMAAPLIMAVVAIAFAGIRNRRPAAQSSIDRTARDRGRHGPARAPLQIVERSAGGYVRVTALPIPPAPGKADGGVPPGGVREGRRIFKGDRPR